MVTGTLDDVVGPERSEQWRKVNPGRTGHSASPFSGGPAADWWAGPVMSDPDIVSGWKEHAGFTFSSYFKEQ